MPFLTPIQRHIKLMAITANGGNYDEWLLARARLTKEFGDHRDLPADIRKELRRQYKMLNRP